MFMKKRTALSLDEDVVKSVDKLCSKNLNAKRSTVINSILKNYFKKKGKKNGS